MGALFAAPLHLVLAIALMTTAAFHFMRGAAKQKTGNILIDTYLVFCDTFDNILHFFCILTVFAFGYSYGFMEAVKLLIVCLMLPAIGHVLALIIGTSRWNFIANLIAMPLGIACALYIFPHLNWFGIL